jgi:hypothetical protein
MSEEYVVSNSTAPNPKLQEGKEDVLERDRNKSIIVYFFKKKNK